MKLRITVHGVPYDVDVEILDPGDGFVAPRGPLPDPRSVARNGAPSAPKAAAAAPSGSPSSVAAPARADATSSLVASPIAGTVVELRSKVGSKVAKDDVLLVIEAMKMNTSIAAPVTATIKTIAVAVGDSVREGQTLVEFE